MLTDELVATADLKHVFDRMLLPPLLATWPFLEIRSPAPQVFLTMHRGDALDRGAELAVFLIDAPQVHFNVHEGQLHLLAKILEYSFNYSRFLPNWRAQPSQRLHRAAPAALVRDWWRRA